jgi:hypothetical protein
VNLSENGSIAVVKACLAAGIGIEAGVWTVDDAEKLVDSGLGSQVTRVLIEPVDVSASDAIPLVESIHGVLDSKGLTAPRQSMGTARRPGCC